MTDGARRYLPWLAIVLGIAVLAFLGRPTAEGRPLDPRNVGPSGAYALAELIDELGASTERLAATPGGADVALVLVDRMSEEVRAEVEEWVRDGGTLVVADPVSPLSPDPQPITDTFTVAPIDGPDCDVAALEDLATVAPGGSAAAYSPPGGAQGCYPAPGGSWLVVEPRGDGTVVSLGGPDIWTNSRLGEHDHAALAGSLLVPSADARVAILRPALPGDPGAQATLTELVPDRVLWGLGQLGLALVLIALWRARRLGKPVPEHQPVPLPGSELVVAAANLSQRAHLDDAAGRTIRDAARRDAARRLGLALDAPASAVAAAARGRGVDDRTAAGALEADDDPVRIAAAADALRDELAAADLTAPAPSRPTQPRPTPEEHREHP